MIGHLCCYSGSVEEWAESLREAAAKSRPGVASSSVEFERSFLSSTVTTARGTARVVRKRPPQHDSGLLRRSWPSKVWVSGGCSGHEHLGGLVDGGLIVSKASGDGQFRAAELLN